MTGWRELSCKSLVCRYRLMAGYRRPRPRMRPRIALRGPGRQRPASLARGFVQILIGALIECHTVPVHAAEVSGYAVLTTDYVFRGVSQSDEHGAVQLGADIALESGWYLGVWASTVDIGGGTPRHRNIEANYYVGYAYNISRKWTVGANAVAYTYPGGRGTVDYDYIDYDYVEFSLTANFDDRLWIEYGHSPDLYDSGETTQNISLYTEWPVGDGFTVGMGAGYYDVSNLVGEGYAYWQLGVTRPFRYATLDLRYHDSSRWLPIISSPARADSRLVLSARFQF